MLQDKINLAEKLAHFSDRWAPRTVAQLNEYDIIRQAPEWPLAAPQALSLRACFS